MGCIGFPRLKSPIPIDEVAQNLAEQEGVMLLPGTAYGNPGNHFRLGLGRRNFPEALDRLDQYTKTALT